MHDDMRSAADARRLPDASCSRCGATDFDFRWQLFANGTRHIRVAIGRDYADVPPTKGVFRGRSANELAVAVQVSLADTSALTRELMPVMTWTAPEAEGPPDWEVDQSQQQQQQQQ